ncbi:MAG: tryptophan-rich sensory protein, partial [Comamonadaceae bacterium]
AIDPADSATVPKAVAAAVASTAFLVPYALSRSTSPTPDHPRVLLWYAALRKPFFKPPDVAVPLAWTAIESGLAVAAYRLLRGPPSRARASALGWLAANVVGIGAWSRLFFGRRNLPASTVAAGALCAAGAVYTVRAREVDGVAGAAGIPLTAWVAFATVLTAALWRRNR